MGEVSVRWSEPSWDPKGVGAWPVDGFYCLEEVSRVMLIRESLDLRGFCLPPLGKVPQVISVQTLAEHALDSSTTLKLTSNPCPQQP